MNTENEVQRSQPLSSLISLYLQERKMVDLDSSRDCMQIILTCFFGGQGQCNLTLRQILLQATNNQAFEPPFTDKPAILSANILVVYLSQELGDHFTILELSALVASRKEIPQFQEDRFQLIRSLFYYRELHQKEVTLRTMVATSTTRITIT